jgi:hypothetical protein
LPIGDHFSATTAERHRSLPPALAYETRRRAGQPVTSPPIIGMAAVGGGAGGLVGHFWKGLSHKDMHELGEALDTGSPAANLKAG